MSYKQRIEVTILEELAMDTLPPIRLYSEVKAIVGPTVSENHFAAEYASVFALLMVEGVIKTTYTIEDGPVPRKEWVELVRDCEDDVLDEF